MTPQTEFIEAVDALAAETTHWSALAHSVQELEDSNSKQEKDLLTSAFSYYYTEPDTTQREKWGIYAPFLELADGRVAPQPLTTLSEAQISLLAEIASLSKSAVVKSRLNDLLWVSRHSERPDIHARYAIDGYLVLSKNSWTSWYRAECLVRALEVAKELNDKDLASQVKGQILAEAKVGLGENDSVKPGVSLRLIEALMRLPKVEQPAEIDETLVEYLKLFAGDTYALQTIRDFQIERAEDQKSKLALREAQVDQLIEEAQNSSGLAKLATLRQAEELARLHGFVDKAASVLTMIQSISEEEMEFKEFSVDVPVPKEEIQKFQDSFFKGNSFQDTLIRFGVHGPPSGNYEKNLKSVDDLRNKHPIQFLLSQIVMGAEGVPLKYLQTEEQHLEAQLSAQERLGISIFGTLADSVIDRFATTYSEVTEEALTEFFTTELISAEVAREISIGFQHFIAGSVNISAHLLYPRIEGILREIARRLGLAVIKMPTADQPGQVITLGTVLKILAGKMDESWRRYLVNALVDPLGVNIRNRLAHGLTLHASREDAIILLHIACHLRLIKIDTKSNGTKQND